MWWGLGGQGDSGTKTLFVVYGEAFKIVNTNLLEAEQRKQLQAIRAHLDSLEDGGSRVIDIN